MPKELGTTEGAPLASYSSPFGRQVVDVATQTIFDFMFLIVMLIPFVPIALWQLADLTELILNITFMVDQPPCTDAVKSNFWKLHS